MLFSGNLTRQPALTRLAEDHAARGLPPPYRVAGDLARTDYVMNHGFWIGVYPGLTDPMRAFMADEIIAFARARAGSSPRRALPTVDGGGGGR
jgi:CDP-6-deoxy-D-xylo-4-hexulose-3-dehydrase